LFNLCSYELSKTDKNLFRWARVCHPFETDKLKMQSLQGAQVAFKVQSFEVPNVCKFKVLNFNQKIDFLHRDKSQEFFERAPRVQYLV
jgi:hypothetical protein